MSINFCQFVVASILPFLDFAQSITFLLPITEEFNLHHPFAINNDLKESADLSRMYSIEGEIIKIFNSVEMFDIKHPEKIDKINVIYFVSTTKKLQSFFKSLTDFKKPTSVLLILSDEQFNEAYNGLEIEINHAVYFFKKTTQELFEQYTVNRIMVRNKLGAVIFDKFKWESGVKLDFVNRRSNFQGVTLKAMTEATGREMILDESYKEIAPFYLENGTYLVNGLVSGLHLDVLTIMEETLNFTTLLYKRKDRVWGFANVQEDGSLEVGGIMGDIYYNRAELVVTSFGMYYDRALYMDYLPDLYPNYAGLYLPLTDNASEKIDFFLIFSPFAEIMWITIAIATLGVALFKISLLKFHASLKAADVIGFLWTSFIAFFGGKPTPTSIDSKRSYKAVVFTSLLAGVVMWIAYRSYLSAALAISFKSYPFTDMESLSKTNWKLFSSGKSSGIGKTFTNSLEGTPFNKVYKNNMANDSFIKNPIELIEKTLATPQSALFRTQSSIRASDYFQNCKIEEIWLYKIASFAYATTQGSKYNMFMRRTIFDITQSGTLNHLRKKWAIWEPDCSPLRPTGKPISLEKLFSAFVVIMIGVAIAFLTFIVECFHRLIKRCSENDVIEFNVND